MTSGTCKTGMLSLRDPEIKGCTGDLQGSGMKKLGHELKYLEDYVYIIIVLVPQNKDVCLIVVSSG